MNPFIQQLLNKARNTAVRAATGFDVQHRRNMSPQVRRVLGLGALNPYSTPIVSAAKKDPSLLTAATKGALVFPGVRTSGGLVGGAAWIDAANQTGLTGAIEGGLNQVGPGLDRFFGAVIPKGVQDFGKSMEQYGWGALGGLVPGEAGSAPLSRPLNAIDTGKYGPTDWNPSANPRRVPTTPVPSSGAADRAYQSAKAETAAMVATDPLMQQWSAAQKAKDYTTADQLGKQIWQNKYGGGPMGQPGGAVGSFNPLMQKTFGYQTGMSGGAGEYTMGPSPLVPQVDPALNPAGPTYALGEGPRLMNFSDEKVTPEMIKAYQEQLLKQAASK